MTESLPRRSLLVTGLIMCLLNLCGSYGKTNGQSLPPPPKARPKNSISLEAQLSTLGKLGFNLNPGISLLDVDRWPEGKKEFEDPPFMMLYITLGQTIEREPWTPLTDRVWDFDVEAIEDTGDYVEIMKNMQRISRGELRFENLKDFVDIENEKAWVSFKINGKSYRWNLKVEDDYVDETLFTKLVSLTRVLRTKGRYTYFFTGGQDAVIGYETPEDLAALKRVTGLKIVWLS